MVGNLLVEGGLSEARVVSLVVPVAPVADQIDDHVLVEPLAELDRESRRVNARLGIVGVHVEDGGLDDLGQVARVAREAVVGRVGGEADLVVHDDVDRPAGRVAVELGERERLRDQTLPGERGVAVDQDRHHAAAIRVAEVVLLGANHALRHGVDRLQVARVRAEREVDRVTRAQAAVAREAAVVLDVAGALSVAWLEPDPELGEHRPVGHAHRVYEHVEAAAVRHGDDHLAAAEPLGVLDQEVEQRNQRVPALDREPLLTQKPLVQELLEPLRRKQHHQGAHPLLAVELGAVAKRLHPLDEPVAALLLAHLHELDREAPTVGLAQHLDELPRRRLARAEEVPAVRGYVHALRLDPVLAGVEKRMGVEVAPERVEVGDQVTVGPVGVDQAHDADRGGHRAQHRRHGDRRLLCSRSAIGAARLPVRGWTASEQPVEELHPVRGHGAATQDVVFEEALDVGAVLGREQRGQICVRHPFAHLSLLRPRTGLTAPACARSSTFFRRR
jgi:hypothetical protein